MIVKMFKKHICNNECETYIDNFFSSMIEGILSIKAIYDENGEASTFTVLEMNKAFENMFGVSKESIVGKTYKEVYPDIVQEWIDICKQIAVSGGSKQSDIHLEVNDKHFKVNIISPVKGNIITFISEITDQIKADEVLKKHFLLFENAYDILLYLRADGTIIDANKTAVGKYGYSYVELLNMNIQELRHPLMAKFYNKQMEVSASEGVVFEGIHIRKDGTSFPVEVSSRSIDVNGELLRVHIIRDITERKEAEEKIRYLANYDALTGIPNRGHLMNEFKNTLELSAKEGLKFAVMLFDVDKFKAINDAYGHNAGDEVLKTVALRLKEAVGKTDILGRLGGDEFLIIQTAIDSKEEVSALAEKILKAICKPISLGSTIIDLRISLGAAIYPLASKELKDLIHCADTAMYEVKQRGGNFYKVY
jgi:diguanylate cyclase (GGDEF)-like protein/PAS domain S-box-containing protein